jgi:hypothetical protein
LSGATFDVRTDIEVQTYVAKRVFLNLGCKVLISSYEEMMGSSEAWAFSLGRFLGLGPGVGGGNGKGDRRIAAQWEHLSSLVAANRKLVEADREQGLFLGGGKRFVHRDVVELLSASRQKLVEDALAASEHAALQSMSPLQYRFQRH